MVWGVVGRGGAEGTASRRHPGHLEGFHLAPGVQAGVENVCIESTQPALAFRYFHSQASLMRKAGGAPLPPLPLNLDG